MRHVVANPQGIGGGIDPDCPIEGLERMAARVAAIARARESPRNQPQVTPAAVSRSPMFRPVRAAVLPSEQTSQ
jgi:hypothetical protein